MSPSQLYAPNSDQSKPIGQAKSPYSVLSSEGPPTEQTLSNISVNNNADNNTISKNKNVKVSKPVPLNKGTAAETKESLQNSYKQNVTAQKPTLRNDDGNEDDDDDDDDKMKKREESVSNVIAPTATLTTEKMKEMMKQMNLEVGSSSSSIGESEGKESVKKKEEGLRNIEGRRKEVGRGSRKDRKNSKKRGKRGKESIGRKA